MVPDPRQIRIRLAKENAKQHFSPGQTGEMDWGVEVEGEPMQWPRPLLIPAQPLGHLHATVRQKHWFQPEAPGILLTITNVGYNDCTLRRVGE